MLHLQMLFNISTGGADGDRVSWKVYSIKRTMYSVLFFWNTHICQCWVSIQSVCWVLYIYFLNLQISSASLWPCTKLCCSFIQHFVQTYSKYVNYCVDRFKKKHILNPCVAGGLFSKYDWNKMTCSKCSYLL